MAQINFLEISLLYFISIDLEFVRKKKVFLIIKTKLSHNPHMRTYRDALKYNALLTSEK